jgi:hypothetical protein
MRAATLKVATVGPRAVLDLTDDGRGIDAAALATARESGHLGITAYEVSSLMPAVS